MAKQNKEYLLCKALSDYLKLQYPKVYFHWDLAGLNLSMAQAGMSKAIQKQKGYPDLFIHEMKSGCGGLLIEVKAVDIYKKDGISLLKNEHIEEQQAMHDILNAKGYKATFGIGFDKCKAIIDEYLK